MKKLITIICIIVFTLQFPSGCSLNKRVLFNQFDQGIFGFSVNDERIMPVPKDTILMMTNEEYQKFKDKYFTTITPKEIPINIPDKKKAVLYLQIPSVKDTVYAHEVTSLFLSKNTLTVNIKKTGIPKCAIRRGVNGELKWVLFIEVDKEKLKENMKIITEIR